MLEVTSETEMLDDAVGVDFRFAGGDEHPPPTGRDCRQRLLDAGIGLVLIEADVAKTFAVEFDCAVCKFVGTEEFPKARMQRRTDAPDQVILVRHRMSEPFEGM